MLFVTSAVAADVTVTLTLPAATGVKIPDSSIVAIDSSLTDQTTSWFSASTG